MHSVLGFHPLPFLSIDALTTVERKQEQASCLWPFGPPYDHWQCPWLMSWGDWPPLRGRLAEPARSGSHTHWVSLEVSTAPAGIPSDLCLCSRAPSAVAMSRQTGFQIRVPWNLKKLLNLLYEIRGGNKSTNRGFYEHRFYDLFSDVSQDFEQCFVY